MEWTQEQRDAAIAEIDKRQREGRGKWDWYPIGLIAIDLQCELTAVTEERDRLLDRVEQVGRLTDIVAWLKHHREVNVINRSTGDGGHNGKGNSWSAVAIPEWEVRQKIDELSAPPSGAAPQTAAVKWDITYANCPHCGWTHDTEGWSDAQVFCEGCHKPFMQPEVAPGPQERRER